nr:hypothetical protein [Streptomyces sp. NBC_01497]
MAGAVGAEHAFFSTCGSSLSVRAACGGSLSVKAAMPSVAGPHEKLPIGRDTHKAVISGLILAGIRPVSIDPQWDPDLHLAHPPAPEAYRSAFEEHPGALVTSPTPHGTRADIGAIATLCHERGVPLVEDEAWGAHLSLSRPPVTCDSSRRRFRVTPSSARSSRFPRPERPAGSAPRCSRPVFRGSRGPPRRAPRPGRAGLPADIARGPAPARGCSFPTPPTAPLATLRVSVHDVGAD